MIVREAYDIIEVVVWLDLQSHETELVKRPGFTLCFHATKEIMRHLQPLSLQFPEEKAKMLISPKQLFLTMNDAHGKIACLAMILSVDARI
jgi:hypothetical protein